VPEAIGVVAHVGPHALGCVADRLGLGDLEAQRIGDRSGDQRSRQSMSLPVRRQTMASEN
jgi:hypothetical protein